MASVLLALLVGGAFAVLLQATANQRDSSRGARQTHEVLSAANRLERLVVDLETGQRGFLITGEERFLAPWTAARRAIPGAADAMVELTADPRQRRRALEIVAAVRAYLGGYSIPLVRQVRAGDPSARGDAVAADGKRRLDAIRARFEAFTTEERRLSSERLDRAEDDAHDATVAAIAGLAGSVLLIALFTGYMTRAVVLPVRRAAGMAGRLAEGDLSARLPETGVDEIGELEAAFNTMGRSLERNRDELAWNAREQAALRRVATRVANGEPPAALFGAVAEEVGRLIAADSVVVARFEEDACAHVLAAWGAPRAGRALDDRLTRKDLEETPLGAVWREARAARADRAVAAPVSVEGRLWGGMEAWTEHVQLRDDAEARITAFAELVATAIANAESRDALAASRARVVATADETRRRIERDLHDGAQQRLVHTVITLKLAQRAFDGERSEPAELVDEALDHAEQATESLRELVHGILPAALSRGGLRPAVDGLAARVPIPVTLDVTSERLPPALEATAYFVIAESLTNVVKHARATSAAVTAAVRHGRLEVEVRDDGAGGATLDGSSGLLGLQDRAAAVDGELRVDSPPGGGTVVSASLPVPAT